MAKAEQRNRGYFHFACNCCYWRRFQWPNPSLDIIHLTDLLTEHKFRQEYDMMLSSINNPLIAPGPWIGLHWHKANFQRKREPLPISLMANFKKKKKKLWTRIAFSAKIIKEDKWLKMKLRTFLGRASFSGLLLGAQPGKWFGQDYRKWGLWQAKDEEGIWEEMREASPNMKIRNLKASTCNAENWAHRST